MFFSRSTGRWLAAFCVLGLTALACNFSFSTAPPTATPAPTATSHPAPTPAPTKSPPPTEAPAPTEMPAPTNQPEPTAESLPAFFTEEFDTQASGEHWSYYLYGPNSSMEDKLSATLANGQLSVQIDYSDIYVYFLYDPYIYYNTITTLDFNNRGVNSQNIGLVCRASDEGWYEFSVGNDGLWYLYAYTPDGGYKSIANGGSNKIHMGKDENQYSLICQDNVIRMFINGTEVTGSPVKDTTYFFQDGQVGFTVSSLGVYPVKVSINWFDISEP